MQRESNAPAPQEQPQESYSEPLLIKHEPLRNLTGQKYGEKNGSEKMAAETA